MDKREIRFDGWHVDFASGEVTKDGHTHRLQDQPLQILDELTLRRGEVVTREHLIARLWPTGVVEFDTGLNTAIRKLRGALGDDADEPRYIETLPRKGYRFIGQLDSPPRPADPIGPGFPATPAAAPAATVTGRRASDRRAPIRRLTLGFGSIIAAMVLAVIAWNMPGKLFRADDAGAVQLPTVVVLPLVDMSLEQNEQALCDGLTEELSNWLAHIPTLRVVARTSAFAFKGRNLDVRNIARQLNATHVLEGSLRRSGDQLRITTQLIEASSGLHIWSKSFNLPIGDIFLIEDTVSRAVADALHLELAANTTEQWAQRQPEKMEAYELYLLGRARERKRTTEDNIKAADFFRRAIAADPQYALAHVGLAQTLLRSLSLNRAPLEDVTAEAEPLINRALQLSPALPDAIAMKGWLLTEQFKLDEAMPLLQRAIAANPNDAASHRLLGNLYDRRADPKTALERYSNAATLDPLDFLSQVLRCQELVDLDELDDAEAACARARELEPGNLWGPLATSWIARARGDTETALSWINEARKIAPSDGYLSEQLIDLLVTQGRTKEARASLNGAGSDFYPLAREANVVIAERGAAGLRAWLQERKVAETAITGADLTELARLQYVAGDAAAARATLAHAQRIVPLSSADLFDGSQIRHEYSAALFHAGIELQGGGDRIRAMALLRQLDQMLATYEKNGGRHYGLYALRASSLAMQGRKAEAQAALRSEWKHGWRTTWRAHADPYLGELELPK